MVLLVAIIALLIILIICISAILVSSEADQRYQNYVKSEPDSRKEKGIPYD